MANNTKKAIIRIALLDEKATFDNVIIEFSLKLFSNIDQSTSYKLSETTFKKDTPLKVEVNFSMFSELEDVIITYISGNYLTNTSREKDWDKSNLIKDELYSKLSVFDEETELTINTKINVSVDGNKESISSTLLIRESPFYFATITDNAGIIITENEDYFDTYEYGRYNDIYYYRLLSSFTNLEDDIKTDA